MRSGEGVRIGSQKLTQAVFDFGCSPGAKAFSACFPYFRGRDQQGLVGVPGSELNPVNERFEMKSSKLSSRCRTATQLLGGLFVVLLLSVPAFSQGNAGRILGTVTDQSGGVVAGATVTVVDVTVRARSPAFAAEVKVLDSPVLHFRTVPFGMPASSGSTGIEVPVVVLAQISCW